MSRALQALPLALGAVLGALTTWKVFEADLFWLARAGNEILAGHAVQTVDSWSYTAKGTTWLNFQWLSTVTFGLLSRAADGYRAFPLARGMLVAAWAALLLRLCARGGDPASRPRLGKSLALAVLAPWAYLCCVFRLQMRPDLFGALCFVSLLTVLGTSMPARRVRAFAVALLVLWANFHSGTSPIGVFVFAAYVLLEPAPLGERGLWCLAAGASWFATPLGWRVLEVFGGNVVNYDATASGNPDFQPFRWALLNYHNGGWSLVCWFVLVVAFVPLYLRAKPEDLPRPYRNRLWVLGVGAVLTGLTFSKIRAIHYDVAFLLPALGGALAGIFSRWPLAAAPAVAALWLGLLPDQTLTLGRPLGLGVNELEVPVRMVELLRGFHAHGHLLNSYEFGGYVVGALPELPDAIDGRELPFLSFRVEWEQSRTDVARHAAFLRNWDVNVVLERTPSPRPGQQGLMDPSRALYPRAEWALVGFDDCSVVYARRIPEHEAWIREREYYFIERAMPANFAANSPGLPDSLRDGTRAELERCLREQPGVIYCALGHAAFLLRGGDRAGAVNELEAAARAAPRSPDVLFELADAYEQAGRPADAVKARSRFERIAVPIAVQ